MSLLEEQFINIYICENVWLVLTLIEITCVDIIVKSYDISIIINKSEFLWKVRLPMHFFCAIEV